MNEYFEFGFFKGLSMELCSILRFIPIQFSPSVAYSFLPLLIKNIKNIFLLPLVEIFLTKVYGMIGVVGRGVIPMDFSDGRLLLGC